MSSPPLSYEERSRIATEAVKQVTETLEGQRDGVGLFFSHGR